MRHVMLLVIVAVLLNCAFGGLTLASYYADVAVDDYTADVARNEAEPLFCSANVPICCNFNPDKGEFAKTIANFASQAGAKSLDEGEYGSKYTATKVSDTTAFPFNNISKLIMRWITRIHFPRGS